MMKKLALATFLVMVVISSTFFNVSALSDSKKVEFTVTNNVTDSPFAVTQLTILSDLSGTHLWEGADMYSWGSPYGDEYISFLTYAKHTDSSGNVTYETFDRYDYIEKMVLRFSFRDGHQHSGYITYSNSNSGRALLSDNPNVSVTANRIVFNDVTGFEVYVPSYWINQSSVSLHATYTTITLSSCTELDSTEDLLTANNAYLESIYNRLGAGNGSVYTLLTQIYTEQLDQGLTIDEINTALTHCEEVLGDIYTELLDQGSTLDDINNFLTTYKVWDIPVESFSINWALFYNLGNNYSSIVGNDFWQQYPIFNVSQNQQIFSAMGSSGHYIDFIVGINQNITTGTAGNYFSVNNGTVQLVRHIGQFTPSYRFFQIRVSNSTSNIVNVTYTGPDAKLIGIYLGRDDNHIGLSTTFLENWFSSDINSTSNDIEDIVDEFDDASDDLHDLEDSAINDLDDSLEDLDLNPDIINSQSFINSGNFIKTMFDRLVINTPLQPILLLALTLGVASLFIGRNR